MLTADPNQEEEIQTKNEVNSKAINGTDLKKPKLER